MQYAFKDLMIHVSAIHITYRISLRSSSLREPRDPLSKVVILYFIQIALNYSKPFIKLFFTIGWVVYRNNQPKNHTTVHRC